MTHRMIAAGAGALLLMAGGQAMAQSGQPAQRPAAQPLPPAEPISATAARYGANTNGEPDVVLDIPKLSVKKIDLQVDGLEVHISLDARLGNLLKITAGADAKIDKVKLVIEGVDAQAKLVVRLDNVAAIIDRTLTTVDRNPQLIEKALGTVDNAVSTVGGVAETALQPDGVVSRSVDSLGRTVVQTVDSAGNTIEQTLGKDGKVVSQRTVKPAARQ